MRNIFLNSWLRGTTCFDQTELSAPWESDCGKFFIAKHSGHSIYCGVTLETIYCGVTYYLYKTDVTDDFFGKKFIKRWEGRWNKYRQEEAEDIVKKYKQM